MQRVPELQLGESPLIVVIYYKYIISVIYQTAKEKEKRRRTMPNVDVVVASHQHRYLPQEAENRKRSYQVQTLIAPILASCFY
jgi:hypothetical protein